MDGRSRARRWSDGLIQTAARLHADRQEIERIWQSVLNRFLPLGPLALDVESGQHVAQDGGQQGEEQADPRRLDGEDRAAEEHRQPQFEDRIQHGRARRVEPGPNQAAAQAGDLLGAPRQKPDHPGERRVGGGRQRAAVGDQAGARRLSDARQAALLGEILDNHQATVVPTVKATITNTADIASSSPVSIDQYSTSTMRRMIRTPMIWRAMPTSTIRLPSGSSMSTLI